MLFKTRASALASLREFVPNVRARHCVIKLVSGDWTRTLGPPSDVTDALGRTLRAVHVRGCEWRQEHDAT